MVLKYDAKIQDSAIHNNLRKITNQIYKLLPEREEGADWQTPLTTIMEELAGMDSLLIDQHDTLFPLLCKLEGLLTLEDKEDFFLYRRTIFECLGLVNSLMTKWAV